MAQLLAGVSELIPLGCAWTRGALGDRGNGRSSLQTPTLVSPPFQAFSPEGLPSPLANS